MSTTRIELSVPRYWWNITQLKEMLDYPAYGSERDHKIAQYLQTWPVEYAARDYFKVADNHPEQAEGPDEATLVDDALKVRHSPARGGWSYNAATWNQRDAYIQFMTQLVAHRYFVPNGMWDGQPHTDKNLRTWLEIAGRTLACLRGQKSLNTPMWQHISSSGSWILWYPGTKGSVAERPTTHAQGLVDETPSHGPGFNEETEAQLETKMGTLRINGGDLW